MNKIRKKREVILIVVILTLSLLLSLGIRLFNTAPAAQVEISVDGEVVQLLNLSEDTEVTVQGYHGGTNHLIIRDGRVRADEATCPDLICVSQGWISQTGQSIVCLPNRMIARIIGE